MAVIAKPSRIDKTRFLSRFEQPPPRSMHRRSWRRLRRGAAEPNSGDMAHGAGGFAAAALGHHHRRPQPAPQVDNDAHVDNAAAAGRWPGVPAPPSTMVPGLWRRRRPLCHRRRRRREQRRGQCACHLPISCPCPCSRKTHRQQLLLRMNALDPRAERTRACACASYNPQCKASNGYRKCDRTDRQTGQTHTQGRL